MKVINSYLVYPMGSTAYMEVLYECEEGKWILLGREIDYSYVKKLLGR